MINRLKVLADDLKPLMTEGEETLALQLAMHFDGHEDLGQKPPTLGDGFIEGMLTGYSPYVQDVVDKFVGGTSLVGWPGCEAQQLALVMSNHDLLLTDRRLMVVEFGAIGVAPRVLWERDRRYIISIKRAPRFGQTGRIRIVMADGSAVMLVLGLIDPRGARRLVEAWGEVEGTAR